MQERRCSVCGRILIKTRGTIGPVCGRKNGSKLVRSRRRSKKYVKKLNIFKETHGGQSKDSVTNSKTKKQKVNSNE